jgi:hypothetical protein
MANKAELQQVREVTSEEANTSLEANEAVVSSLITLQVAYLKMTQSLFLNWMELLTPLWWQPIHEQQDAFQRLMAAPMQPYLDWMLAPLTLSRKLVDASMTTLQREREQREREGVS